MHQKVWGKIFLGCLIHYFKIILLNTKFNCPTLFDALPERAIRNIKVKQKVPGQFKSGQNAFCVIRSVIDTLLKRGVELLPCLNQINKLQPV